MRYYKIMKNDIVKALVEGKKIILTTEYNNNYQAVFTLNGIRLHGNSVRAAFTEINGEKISNSFLIPDASYKKKIYYSYKYKSLLITRY